MIPVLFKKKVTFLSILLLNIAALLSAKTIKIAVQEEMLQQTFYTKTASDFYVPFFDKIAQYTGWKYEFVMLPLSKSLQNLQSGSIDIVLEIPKNEETQKSYLLSSVPCSIKYDLLVTAKNNRFRNGDTTELNNTFIGISSENRAQEHLLDSFAKKHNLHIIKVHYPDQSRMLLDAESGFIDLFMTNTMNSFSKEKLIYNFGSYPTYIAFNKNNPQLKSQFEIGRASCRERV